MRRILLAGICLLAVSGKAHAQISVWDGPGDASLAMQVENSAQQILDDAKNYGAPVKPARSRW